MTRIVALNVVLIAIAVAGIVGLLAWSIVSALNRQRAQQTRSRRHSRRYSMSELSSESVQRGFTTFMPMDYVDDSVQRVVAGRAGRMPSGM